MRPVTSKLSFRTCSPGSYNNPNRAVAFNVTERWSEDVSADVAHELRRRCDLQVRDVPFTCRSFTDRYEGRYHDVQLPLPMPGLHVVSSVFLRIGPNEGTECRCCRLAFRGPLRSLTAA
jgi:hypothetical protein